MPVPGPEVILSRSKASVSGIVESKLTGDRLVPESRRADGSLRKERKIRPGYVPPEEVEKFKSARQLDAERTARPKGVVPGMSASAVAQAVASANATNKAAKKNQKRKDKRDEESLTDPEGTPDDWDAEDPVEVAKEPPPPEEPKEVDPEKRAKQLNKKLRQAEALRDRKDAGESLLPEQEEKVASIASLADELAKLSI